MRHEYYQYNKEQLLTNPKMTLRCKADNAEVFQGNGRSDGRGIRSHNEKGEKTVFICPVGPVGQYPYFVDMVNEQNISLKNVWFINMDEYLDDEKHWVSKDHPLSFRGFMDTHRILQNQTGVSNARRAESIPRSRKYQLYPRAD